MSGARIALRMSSNRSTGQVEFGIGGTGKTLHPPEWAHRMSFLRKRFYWGLNKEPYIRIL